MMTTRPLPLIARAARRFCRALSAKNTLVAETFARRRTCAAQATAWCRRNARAVRSLQSARSTRTWMAYASTVVLAGALAGSNTNAFGQTTETLPGMRGGYTVPSTLDTTGGLTVNLGFGVEYLVVGGGGGGGGAQERSGGGGGAGGVADSAIVVTSTGYSITVGSGGAGGSGGNAGSSGGGSSFGAISVLGGGGGAGASSTLGENAALTGGSGGGGAGTANDPTAAAYFGAAGTSGQGTSGANGTASASADGQYGGGGGGGGGAASNQNGGAGHTSGINGGLSYAFGGGGGKRSTTGGSGGSSGGGGAGGAAANGSDATVLGSGGGGAGSSDNTTSTGGNGKPGVVYVKYKGSSVATATGGNQYGGSSQLYEFFNNQTLTFDLSGITQSELSATIANPITGTGAFTFDGFGGLTLSAANTFSGDTRVTTSTLGLANVNALQNSTLDLNASDSGTVSFDVTGDNTYALGGLSGSRNLAYGANSLSVGGNDADATYTGNLSGSGGLTKTGAGTWTLGGTNTFTGGVNIAAGTLAVSETETTVTSLGDSGNVITFTGPGTLRTAAKKPTIQQDITAASGGSITLSARDESIYTGSITTTSTEKTFIAPNSSVESRGTNTAWNGPIQIEDGGVLKTWYLSDVAEPIQLNTTNSSGSAAKYEQLTGAPAALTFNNRYFELMGTTAKGIVHSNGPGARPFTVNTDLVVTGVGDKTFQLSGASVALNQFSGKIDDGTGSVISLRKENTGRWRVSNAANGYSGTTELASGGGTLEVGKLADGGLASSIGTSSSSAANLLLGNNSIVRYVGTGDSTDRSFTINGTAAGHTGTLEASGTGAVTYTNTASPAYGTINQTRTLGLGGTNTADNTFAANVADNGTGLVSLAKSGSGTWVLTGASTYTGTTTVSAGRLAVNGSLGNTAATISGGTLGGAGSLGGSVNVNSGGTLAPGNSIESLAVGATSFDAGGTYAYEVDSSVAVSAGADLLTVDGNLSLASGSLLTFSDIAANPVAFANGTIFTMINYSGTWDNGLFTYGSTALADGDTFTVGSQDWVIDYDATAGGSNFTGDYLPSSSFVTVTAVPEPSAFAICAGGLALVGFGELVRRRRKAAGGAVGNA